MKNLDNLLRWLLVPYVAMHINCASDNQTPSQNQASYSQTAKISLDGLLDEDGDMDKNIRYSKLDEAYRSFVERIKKEHPESRNRYFGVVSGASESPDSYLVWQNNMSREDAKAKTFEEILKRAKPIPSKKMRNEGPPELDIDIHPLYLSEYNSPIRGMPVGVRYTGTQAQVDSLKKALKPGVLISYVLNGDSTFCIDPRIEYVPMANK